MKKIIMGILSAALLASLVSCTEASPAATSSDTPSEVSSDVSSAVSSVEPTVEPTVEPSPEPHDIFHLFMKEDLVGVMPETLPVYEEGSIRLANEFANAPDGRKKRGIYYKYGCAYVDEFMELPDFPGTDQDKIDISRDMSRMDKEINPEENEIDEMYMVTLIKRYNIPREVMEQAVERYYNGTYREEFEDPERMRTHEWGELPNLDIIYTLDNDIINEYYRFA